MDSEQTKHFRDNINNIQDWKQKMLRQIKEKDKQK